MNKSCLTLGRNMMIVVIAATPLSPENRIMNARTTNKIVFACRIARFGFLLVLGLLALRAIFATAAPVKTDAQSKPDGVATETNSLKPPDKGQIPVAFVISDGAVVIDFCGPWEVFQDVMIPGSEQMPFRLYTVAETKKPIRTSGGMQIVPDYTIQDAPPPKVIVIPAQSSRSPALLEVDQQIFENHGCHHVGLHWRIRSGPNRTAERQSRDHVSRRIRAFRNAVSRHRTQAWRALC
jgi:hypothetical protein